MEVAKIVSTSFVRIEATWPAGRSRALVDLLDPIYVIVRRGGASGGHYLLSPREVLIHLGRVAEWSSTEAAFDWEARSPAPLIDAQVEQFAAPDPCIVVDEGCILGVFSASLALKLETRELFPLSGVAVEPGRSLVAEFPEKVPLNETASLLVSLTEDFAPWSSLSIALPEGSTLDIVVQPRRGLALVGSGEGSLVVAAGEGLPLQFKIRGVEPGAGLLRVLAFSRGQPIGMISLAPIVVESSAGAGATVQTREGPIAPTSNRMPDLSLLILEAGSGAETVLTLRLTSADQSLGYNLKPYGPIRLRRDPYAYFQDYFRDIESLPIRTAADRARVELRLAAKGANLFESLVPEDLRRALWELRGRITSVQVQSEEPWIPWELCKLVGRNGDEVEEGPFFCEAFELTRWFPGLPQVPRLGLKNIALVVPGDSGLAFATAERDYMLSLASERRRVARIPATFLDLHQALASGAYDGWHFSGHGSFRDEPNPERSAMILEEGDRLTPEDLSGRVANLGKASPLVFLNACQIGQSEMSLTGIGGWASRFLRAGAGAFVGAYWSVYDQPAFDFARMFYGRLLAGSPVGKAAREARLAVRNSGDPTWMAYTVYADPMAAVEVT